MWQEEARQQVPNGIYFTPLGGMGGIGKKNCYLVYNDNHDALMLDCGQEIPSGVPDFSPIFEKELRVRGICISHSHRDHAGALADFYKLYAEAHPREEMPPVFVSAFGDRVIRNILYGNEVPLPRMVNMQWNHPQKIGPFSVRAFPVIHSTPGSCGFSVKAKANNGDEKHIVYPGDFKLQGNEKEERRFEDAMHMMRNEGVDVLLLDSTNAQEEGYAAPEWRVIKSITDVMHENPDGLFGAATFSSHIQRLRAMCKFAHEQDRKVLVLGSSMVRYLRCYEQMLQKATKRRDWRWWSAYSWRQDGEIRYADVPDNAVILATGGQAEEDSGVLKFLNGKIPLSGNWNKATDSFMFAADTIPLPEIKAAVADAVDLASSRCKTVFLAPETATHGDPQNARRGLFHETGHAKQEDLWEIADTLRPRLVIPVHAHKDRREEVGGVMPAQVLFQMVEEGEVLDV